MLEGIVAFFAHWVPASAWNRFLLALLATWMVLSVWNQYLLVASLVKRRRYERLKWDVMSLIPCWTFWANPPSDEWQLLYRDRLADGHLTPWKTAGEAPQGRFRWIWNPDIRKWKAIRNFCSPLLRCAANGEKQNKELFVSRSYVALAVYISAIRPSPLSECRQFMIARTFGFDSETAPEILFVSPLFRVEGTP